MASEEAGALPDGPFQQRVAQFGPDLRRALHMLYGARSDFEAIAARLMRIAQNAYAERPHALRALDRARAGDPDWFLAPDRIGYSCYVDRFAGDLRGIGERVPYLQELGITYLHLLPFLKMRAGANDGGFAVSSYREVEPELGNMADLARLAGQLRAAGISLCADLLCNHTSDDHEWALRAKAGEAAYRAYYLTFESEEETKAFEPHLKQVFAASAPGNFTYCPQMQRWVWTTFYPYQWDLDYANPAVLQEMAHAMLHLANQGVEVFRLDSAPFLWKQKGSDCQNLPQAHAIIQVLRALAAIAAPGVLLKAEAIVPAAQLVDYLGVGPSAGKECHLAYNTTLMTLQWAALARGNAELLAEGLAAMPRPPEHTGWLSYVRCHDDIGWGVLREGKATKPRDWAALRTFLSQFYAGESENSFASGAAFQVTQAQTVHGTLGSLASLCGLERALNNADRSEIDLAVRRILLMTAVSMAFGGIALINMGDELGQLNHAEFARAPRFDGDGRWLHRGPMDWNLAAQRYQPGSVVGQVFSGFRAMAMARAGLPLANAPARVEAGPPSVLRLIHAQNDRQFLLLANFSDQRVQAALPAGVWRDALSRENGLHGDISLDGYAAR
jgi:amylosucrase